MSEHFLRNIPLTPAGIISNIFGCWHTCLVTMSPAVESFTERSTWKGVKLGLLNFCQDSRKYSNISFLKLFLYPRLIILLFISFDNTEYTFNASTENY